MIEFDFQILLKQCYSNFPSIDNIEHTAVTIVISDFLVTLKALHLQSFFHINCPRNRKNLEWNEKSNCTRITCIYYNKPYFLNVQQLKNKKKTIIILLTSSSNNKQGLNNNSSQQYQQSANNAQTKIIIHFLRAFTRTIGAS